jgi:plasmid stability protein
MATLTIRNLPEEIRDELRMRAARNGRSMEAEARQVIAQATLPLVLERLRHIPFTIIAFDRDLAEKAGALREPTRESNVSFADRACLALAIQNALPVLTGDRNGPSLIFRCRSSSSAEHRFAGAVGLEPLPLTPP